MRVLHLVKTGVGATWVWRQISVLKSLGVEVHVAIAEDGPMLARYKDIGATVHRLPVDIAKIDLVQLPAAFSHFRGLVGKINPDLIHSHFVGTTLLARMAMGRNSTIPRLFQVPGPLHLERLLTRSVDIYSSGSADYWCATCELTRSIYLRQNVDPERVMLSYYGTDVDTSRPAKIDPRELRDSIGVPKDDFVVGMVAFMYPPKRWLGQRSGIKGHEDLIEAIGLLLDRGLQVTGLFIGGAWGGATRYEEHLRDLGRRRLGSRGIFLGTRDDVYDLYKCVDVAVHPSHSENLGGAGESLLFGVPTVATNVGGLPDIVQDGRTGLLADPNSPLSLANAIQWMLDDPHRAQNLAMTGRRLTESLLDVRRTGREMLDIYTRFVQHHSRVLKS